MDEESDSRNNFKGLTADYFDRRSETYDQDALFPRLAFTVIRHADLRPGLSVLDVGTGTGRLALQAAKIVGNTGSVVAVDLSAEMLTQGHFKAGMESLTNIQFIQSDIEAMEWQNAAFDRILCSSALILLIEPQNALKTWHRWLKPNGIVSFDAPGEPFGINGIIAEVASEYGIELPYAVLANTVDKCRSLLKTAGFEIVDISPELMQEHSMLTEEALAVWEKSLAHPACHELAILAEERLQEVHSAFEAKVMARSREGTIISKIVMNVVTGRKSGT